MCNFVVGMNYFSAPKEKPCCTLPTVKKLLEEKRRRETTSVTSSSSAATASSDPPHTVTVSSEEYNTNWPQGRHCSWFLSSNSWPLQTSTPAQVTNLHTFLFQCYEFRLRVPIKVVSPSGASSSFSEMAVSYEPWNPTPETALTYYPSGHAGASYAPAYSLPLTSEYSSQPQLSGFVDTTPQAFVRKLPSWRTFN